MSLTPETPALRPRFDLFGLFLSTLAILALTAVLFLGASIMTSLIGAGVVGADQMKAAYEQLKDITALRGSEDGLLLLQVIGLLVYLAHGTAICIVARFRPQVPFIQRVAFFDWRGDRQFWYLLAAMLAYVAAAGFALEGYLPESTDWVLLPKAPVGLFLSLMLIVGLAPIAEELLFRGWIYTGLRMRLAFVPAVLITSALFALAHFERTLIYALVVFPVGLSLGFVRERYGSIKASMVFHGLFNLFAWVLNVLQAV